MGLELVALTEADLAARRPGMIAGFAASVADNFAVSPEQAEAEAVRQLEQVLPAGAATEGQLLFRAVDDDGAEVGFLWLSLPGTFFPELAWLAEIEVAADRRGRGHGTQMIAAGEAELRERGIDRLGLHVFGHNTGAQRLYDRLGYRILHQVRAWPVAAVPPTDHTVTLAPMTPAEYEARLAALIATQPGALARDPAGGAEAARQAAEQRAPAGVHTEGAFLRTVRAAGQPVGWIWFQLPTPREPGNGLVVHLEIEPGLRRQGHGRRALAAAEAELARHQVPRIGLNVPGEPGARAFADALDLPLVSQQMIKDL
jgi:mycothiol synthase